MNITLIAAMAKNRVIGKDNRLIWHMPEDLKRFKRLTKGHHVIMGRKTFESMDKPLPYRTNIIITSQKDYKADGCLVVHSVKEAVQSVKDDEQPFIIGGGQIYKESMDLGDTIELTIIDHEFEGDTKFPEIDLDRWELKKVEHLQADAQNPYNYDFLTYIKKV